MKITTSPKLKLELNKTEARGIRKVYSDMLELIGDEIHWIKENYYRKDVTGLDQYCLIGAAKKIDGKWEELAEAFMLFNSPAGYVFAHYDDDDVSLTNLAANGRDEAIEFNDDDSTDHKDILKWLRALIKKADKIIAG